MRLMVVLCVVASGCARLVPAVEYRQVGRIDPKQELQTAEAIHDSIAAATATPSQVTVLMDQIPAGLRYDPLLRSLSVEDGFQHEVIGRTTVTGKKGTFFFVARFLDYRASWRKYLCYWQVPLEWVTLGLWSLVPTSYPCHASSAPLTREEAIEDLRNAALAVGADLVLISSPSGKSVRGQDVKDMSAWLVKIDPRAKPGEQLTPIEFGPDEVPPPPPEYPAPQ